MLGLAQSDMVASPNSDASDVVVVQITQLVCLLNPMSLLLAPSGCPFLGCSVTCNPLASSPVLASGKATSSWATYRISHLPCQGLEHAPAGSLTPPCAVFSPRLSLTQPDSA